MSGANERQLRPIDRRQRIFGTRRFWRRFDEFAVEQSLDPHRMPSLVENTAPHLPYLRRFARALTGGQKSGDAYVVGVLEALIAGQPQ